VNNTELSAYVLRPGHIPSTGDQVAHEQASLEPAVFFANYVQARRPVVLKGNISALRDQATISKLVRDQISHFTLRQLSNNMHAQADLNHLRRVGSSSVVQIEPFNMAVNTFGTAAKRRTTSFPAFLDLLAQDAERGRWYLTTQYDESAHETNQIDTTESEDGDETMELEEEPKLDPICPPPTDKFVLDFPLRPSIIGNLVLSQCNLW
jgi:hypothetical protein